LFSYSFPVVVAILQLRRERIAERMKALEINCIHALRRQIREGGEIAKAAYDFSCWEMIDAGNKGSPNHS
jgi:hypothetical protein